MPSSLSRKVPRCLFVVLWPLCSLPAFLPLLASLPRRHPNSLLLCLCASLAPVLPATVARCLFWFIGCPSRYLSITRPPRFSHSLSPCLKTNAPLLAAFCPCHPSSPSFHSLCRLPPWLLASAPRALLSAGARKVEETFTAIVVVSSTSHLQLGSSRLTARAVVHYWFCSMPAFRLHSHPCGQLDVSCTLFAFSIPQSSPHRRLVRCSLPMFLVFPLLFFCPLSSVCHISSRRSLSRIASPPNRRIPPVIPPTHTHTRCPHRHKSSARNSPLTHLSGTRLPKCSSILQRASLSHSFSTHTLPTPFAHSPPPPSLATIPDSHLHGQLQRTPLSHNVCCAKHCTYLRYTHPSHTQPSRTQPPHAHTLLVAPQESHDPLPHKLLYRNALCTHTFTHTRAHIHLNTHTYRHTLTHTHADTSTHTHISTHTHTYLHTHTHTYLRTHTPIYTHTHTHLHTHTHTSTHTHTDTSTHTHAHTSTHTQFYTNEPLRCTAHKHTHTHIPAVDAASKKHFRTQRHSPNAACCRR